MDYLKKVINFFLNSSLTDLWKALISRRGINNTNQIITHYLKSNESLKLQIGSGKNFIRGWLNTDINPSSGKIAFLDVRKKFPLKDNSFSFIFCEHTLEHISFDDSLFMMKECYRILEKGGIIRIAIPHLDFLFKIYDNPNLAIHEEYCSWSYKNHCKKESAIFENNSLAHVYVINNFFQSWGHKMIHNFDSLKQLMEMIGFTDVERQNVKDSKFPELKDLEKHGEFISEKFNKLETLIIEARKN